MAIDQGNKKSHAQVASAPVVSNGTIHTTTKKAIKQNLLCNKVKVQQLNNSAEPVKLVCQFCKANGHNADN